MRNVGFAGGIFEAEICDLLPSNKGRSSLVFKMIEAYGLNEKCIPITVVDATKHDLMKFHDESFVNVLLKKRSVLDGMRKPISKESDGQDPIESEDEEEEEEAEFQEETNSYLESYGLLYDCPIFPYMSQYVKTVTGSSLSAARFLCQSSNRIAINWNGGRHHCKKAKASGFCYVNDIVLSILELRKKFDKILYIDLDLHHGDGVETAFKFSNKVITLSIHRKDIGFFPGTGDASDIGKAKGVNHCINIPTRHGLSDQSMKRIVKEIVVPFVNSIKPDCIVIQCGCDGLNSDEHQEWNLSIKEFGKVVGDLLNLNIPTLLLGGGGYNHSQAARFWTYVTSIALDVDIQFDILPDGLLESDDFEDYEFWNMKNKNMIDENDDGYIDFLKATILNRY